METDEKDKIIGYDRLKQYNRLKNQEIDDKIQKYVFTDDDAEPSNEVIPTDADTFNGHDIEYFASKESLSTEEQRAKNEEKKISDALGEHLSSNTSHNDIRVLISELAEKLDNMPTFEIKDNDSGGQTLVIK